MADNGTATIDIIDGARASQDGVGYTSYERKAIIDGLTESPTLLNDALDHPQLPVPGDPHPFIDYLFVKGREASATSPTQVTVRLTYARSGLALQGEEENHTTITVGSSTTSVVTNKTALGNVMTVQYDDNRPVEERPNRGSNPQRQTGEVSKDVPLSTLTFSRTETRSEEEISALSRYYTGTINSAVWHGGEPRTWKCTGITGNSSDSGGTFTVNYTFEYNPDTWDVEVAYKDDRGIPIELLEHEGRRSQVSAAEKGIRTFRIYLMTNFNELGL